MLASCFCLWVDVVKRPSQGTDSQVSEVSECLEKQEEEGAFTLGVSL